MVLLHRSPPIPFALSHTLPLTHFKERNLYNTACSSKPDEWGSIIQRSKKPTQFSKNKIISRLPSGSDVAEQRREMEERRLVVDGREKEIL